VGAGEPLKRKKEEHPSKSGFQLLHLTPGGSKGSRGSFPNRNRGFQAPS
jgi:hypothetical protein